MNYTPRFIEGKTIEELKDKLKQMEHDEYAHGRLIDRTLLWDIAHTIEQLGKDDEKMKVRTWNIEAMTGYVPKTTFYDDFSIADRFGIEAVKDTYNRGLETAKYMGYVYLTEFVMVMNWKIWEHFESNNALATLYHDLFLEASIEAEKTLEGDELAYYYRTID